MSRSEGPTVTAKHSQQDSEEDRPRNKGIQRGTSNKKKNLNMENSNRKMKQRMKMSKTLIKESLGPPLEASEETMGGSLLGSPSCSTDGTSRGMRTQARMGQENTERFGKR